MKTLCIVFLAIVAGLPAADLPSEFTFKSTTAGTPSLTLSATSKGQPTQIPIAPTDLIAPASTREKIIQDFWSIEVTRSVKGEKQKVPIVPLAPTDLIGTASDREKLIEYLNRPQAEKRPN